MAVFRVEKNRNFTVMCNYHLQDKRISLKAKGLLSQMLSLPDDWDYTLSGLVKLNLQGKDSIRAALGELERAGYVYRRQTIDRLGKFSSNEYIIYERPQENPKASLSDEKAGVQAVQGKPLKNGEPLPAFPSSDFPTTGDPVAEHPASEKPPQLNTKKPITIRQKTIGQNTNSIPFASGPQEPSAPPAEAKGGKRITREDMERYRKLICENIQYDSLIEEFPYRREELDEIVALMTETVCSTRTMIRVSGENLPSGLVKSRLLKLNREHIRFVFDCLNENTTRIRNIRQYLLAVLYHAPTTINSYYSAKVNHDLYGGA